MSSLEQFSVFKTVAETGNITQASKRLHISQPSVSVQIQNLEREYGAELFRRTNRDVTLTESGQILYEKIVFVLHSMEQAKETIGDISSHQNSCIHIGATLTIGEYLLPHMMGLTHADHTLPRFNAQVANTPTIAEEVLEQELNIGLVEGPVVDNPDLVVEKFWSDELVLVVPIEHPWSKRTEVTFNELVSERFITREKGSGTRRIMELALLRSDFDPNLLNIVLELNSTQAIKEAVMSNLGVTIISALTVQEECRQKRLSMLRLCNCQLSRPLNIITNRKSVLTSEERWFLNKIRKEENLRPLIPVPFLPYPASTDADDDPVGTGVDSTPEKMAEKVPVDPVKTLQKVIPEWHELADCEKDVCRIIFEKGSTNSDDIAHALQTTQRDGLIVLHCLMDRDIIEGYGGSKNRRYRLVV